MPNTNAATIQRDYLEKLYYYALKKTGSKYEAEDLAQDIASQALISRCQIGEMATLNERMSGDTNI